MEENLLRNSDEPQLVLNMDDRVNVGFGGDKNVKNDDVVSDDEFISMMVKVSSGCRVKEECQLIIFQTRN